MQKLAIHSVPRSGSTWLGNIFNSHPNVSFKFQPLFSYAFKDYLNTASPTKTINTFFKLLTESDDAFINQKEGIEKGIIPSFNKNEVITHSCYKEVRYHHILENMLQQCEDIKIILLVRNPLAVLQSWKNATKEFRPEKGWVFEEEWRDAPKKNLGKPEEFNGYNKWKEAVFLFLKLKVNYPNRVSLISYSDLIKDTVSHVKSLFEFSNLELTSETLRFINLSISKNNSDPYSVYNQRIVDNDWKNLPKQIIDYINNDLKNTDLEMFLNE